MDQMNKAIRVHENLSKLEQFAQKQAAVAARSQNAFSRPDKKPSVERSRSGRRARSKSRERRNFIGKKSKIKLVEGSKISRLSHQNLTTKHQ